MAFGSKVKCSQHHSRHKCVPNISASNAISNEPYGGKKTHNANNISTKKSLSCRSEGFARMGLFHPWARYDWGPVSGIKIECRRRRHRAPPPLLVGVGWGVRRTSTLAASPHTFNTRLGPVRFLAPIIKCARHTSAHVILSPNR